MDRRAFLQATSMSSLTLAHVGARAEAPPVPPVPRPGRVDDMDAYLARVDAGLERIGRWSVTADFPAFSGDREAADTLAGSALQTLFITGMLGDLPEDQQQHPGMQERVWAALPRMDDACDRMHAFLSSKTADELSRVQAALRGPDGIAKRVIDALDVEAERTGVSAWRRQQLRDIASAAAWRLANQPPSLVIDEYREKIERVDASDIAAEARRRWLASRVGEELFWSRADAGSHVTTAALANSAQSRRERRIARGAKVMGIGLLIGGLGVALAVGGENGTGVAGLVVATVGAVFFLVGLITLIVGLATPGDPATSPSESPPP